MPVYEYACRKCGEVFEIRQRISEEPLRVHEGCGGPVKRLISLTSFTLKGDGWYSDHYGLKSNGNKSDSNEKSAKPSTSDNSSTSSATPETKTEPKKDPATSAPKNDSPKKTTESTQSAGKSA